MIMRKYVGFDKEKKKRKQLMQHSTRIVKWLIQYGLITENLISFPLFSPGFISVSLTFLLLQVSNLIYMIVKVFVTSNNYIF